MFFGSGVEVADGAADVLLVALSTLSQEDAFSSKHSTNSRPAPPLRYDAALFDTKEE